MNEEQIIARVKDGHINDYAELVERHHVGLVMYCERHVHNRMEAEDIAQKSFIKAYEKLGTFNAKRGRFSTWLYKIAFNETIDTLRKTKKTIDVENIEDLDPFIPDFRAPELLHEVRQAVLALMPPEHRRAIEAYYWEGKSYQAIADEMQVPVNTVRSWLRRAKIQLRSVLS